MSYLCRIGAICAVIVIPACAELERAQRIGVHVPGPKSDVEVPKDKSAEPEIIPGPKTTKAKPAKTQILRGSGKFLNPAPRRAMAFEGKGGSITLNFVNAAITEVVRAVLGDILKINFTVDSSVKGSITLQTSRPIPRAGVLTALESALNVAGVAMVPSEGMYRIVPRSKAPSQGVPTTIAGEDLRLRPGFAVRIVPLQFVSAVEMAKILKPMAFKGTIVRVDSTRNLLVLAAPAPEIRALEDMIAVFDVDWLAGLSLSMIPLEFVNPEILVKEISAILGKDKDNPLKGVLRFLPMTRLNAVLVISTQPAYLRRAADIIAKLDQGGSGTERQLFVYRVQNTDAGEIANTLGQLFGGQGKGPSDLRGALAPQLQPARTTIRAGSQAAQANPQQSRFPTTSGQPGARGQPTPRTRTGGAAGAARKQTSGTAAAFTIDGADQIRVVADKTNNSILVWATPVDYRMVRSILRKLDKVPLQVLIEATIAEVTLNETLRYGVQWFFSHGNSQLTLNTGTAASIAPTIPGFSYFLSGPDVKAVFDALESVTDLNVISSPQLMVLNNQTAELQVGDQVPVLTQQSTTADTNAVITSNVEYRDSGIILRVTPRVNAGGLVTMRIEQEASQIASSTEATLTPTIQQRRISSTVAVQSGDTVVLGGLIKDSRDRQESGIPVLRDIPFLGYFFGKKKNNNDRTELLILITPRVVRNQREVRRVTEEMRKRMRAVVPLDLKIR